jgi:DNA recombination protein RmuC
MDMWHIIALVAGLLLGGLIAYLLARTKYERALARSEAQLEAMDMAQSKLSDTFKALAGDALGDSSQQFLKLAQKTFEQFMTDAKGDFSKSQEAIKGFVQPLMASLNKFDEQVRGLERTRVEAYTKLQENLKNLNSTQQELRRETGNLVTALRRPEVRGRWGEITLKRVVELAGMVEHCDFFEQVTAEDEEGSRLRPDMVVHLPSDRRVVVDSKVPLEAYLEGVSAESEEQRSECLSRHAQQLRTHMNSLSKKDYWKQFEKTPEFVVMFIPGESFFSCALEQEPALIEEGMEKRVVLATPTTLIALLWAVAYGWRQEQLATNAQQISELGKDLYNRMRKLADYIKDIGKALDKATHSYNQAVGSMESRVLPSARKFKDLGIGSGEEIPTLDPTEKQIRELQAAELGAEEEETLD